MSDAQRLTTTNQIMRTIIKDHSSYFVYYALFAFLGLFYNKTLPQQDAILFFSDNRSPLGDAFFVICTHLGEFAPYIVFTLYFLIRNWRMAFFPSVIAILVLAVSDVAKVYFKHPRPVTEFEAHGMMQYVHLVPGVTVLRGFASFPSGHTISAFAIYSFMCFMIAKNDLAQLFFFLLAVLVGVSRIYLVEHFPEDVLFGSFLGVLIAMVVYYFYLYFSIKQTIV